MRHYPAPDQFADDLAEAAKSNTKLRSIDVAALLDRSFVKDAEDRAAANKKAAS